MNRIFLFIVMLIMAGAVVGCSKDTKDTIDTTSQQTGEASDEGVTSEPESNDVVSTDESVKITFLNTKGEIQTQLEEVAVIFEKETGIEIEIIPSGAGTSPFEKMTTLYNSGNAPTISMMDSGDLAKFKDVMKDLSDEKWVADAMSGSLEVAKIEDRILAFPFTVEGFGLIYNKAAIESATGEDFDPLMIKTRGDLEALFSKIKAGGIAPIIISPLDWSLGAHYTQIAFSQAGVDIPGHDEIMSQLASGSLKFSEFEAFNALMDTFDLLSAYNLDVDDPLSGTYDDGARVVATGEAAFWFMGNWAWPQIDELSGDNKEFGFLPVPLDMDGDMNKISAGPTKYLAIDESQSSEEQQAAALQFLNWLIYEEVGQDSLVNICNIIPAFTNITISPEDPLAESIAAYIAEDNFYSMVLTFPSDYWSEVGAYFQKYLAKYSSRDEFYSEMEGYWHNQN